MIDFLAVPLIFLAIFLCSKQPLIAVGVYFLFGPCPFAFTERLTDEFFDFPLGFGLQPVDVVLVGMTVVTVWKLIFDQGARDTINLIKIPTLLLVMYILFEIIRNFGLYGMSAPGEFRGRYFMVFSLYYVAVMFDTKEKRNQLIKFLTYFSIVTILILWLVVGLLTGWEFGAQNRFIHSSLSLALVESFLGLLLFQKFGLMKRSSGITWLLFLPTFILVILDGHRSVWMSIVAILIILMLLGEIRFREQLKFIAVAGALILVVALVFFQGVDKITSFFEERTNAYFNVEEDQTASWRAEIWVYAINAFLEKPLVGDGFGAHGASVFDERTGMPMKNFIHSYYMMTLVKMGLIGMVLLIVFAVRLGKLFYRKLKETSSKMETEYGLVLVAFIILVIVHVYGVPYGIEYYSWLYIGLGLAVVASPPGSIETLSKVIVSE